MIKDSCVRPITVGYTWRRRAAKRANSYAVNKLSEQFAPIQFGVCISGGADTAVSATHRYAVSMPEKKF